MMMAQTHEGPAMMWRRTREGTFNLSNGEGLMASLRWITPGGILAVGQTPSGSWTLQRRGLFHPRISVAAMGSSGELAALLRQDHPLHLVEDGEGPGYLWECPADPRANSRFLDLSSRILLDFEPASPRDFFPIRVGIFGDGVPPAHRDALLLLGCYRYTMEASEEPSFGFGLTPAATPR